MTYPGPTTTTYAYDAFGNRTSLVDGSGTTTTAYNDASEVSSVTPPSRAPVVSYTYDANGNVTNRADAMTEWCRFVAGRANRVQARCTLVASLTQSTS